VTHTFIEVVRTTVAVVLVMGVGRGGQDPDPRFWKS